MLVEDSWSFSTTLGLPPIQRWNTLGGRPHPFNVTGLKQLRSSGGQSLPWEMQHFGQAVSEHELPVRAIIGSEECQQNEGVLLSAFDQAVNLFRREPCPHLAVPVLPALGVAPGRCHGFRDNVGRKWRDAVLVESHRFGQQLIAVAAVRFPHAVLEQQVIPLPLFDEVTCGATGPVLIARSTAHERQVDEVIKRPLDEAIDPLGAIGGRRNHIAFAQDVDRRERPHRSTLASIAIPRLPVSALRANDDRGLSVPGQRVREHPFVGRVHIEHRDIRALQSETERIDRPNLATRARLAGKPIRK